ncbi:MAG: threonylcarbamoyl-AMP synthase [Clostridia bacterium]|nr:threonylcarbamoyl-AMP synthase [Clostridia bacterium]
MDTKIINDINDTTLIEAAERIKNGGLVAFPTETVYGLGANALDPTAAKKIYEAKGRPSNNPLIIHLAKPEDAEQYAYTNETYYRLAERFMPGPLTVILPKKDIIPYEVTGGLDTVAIRVPADRVAHTLIELAGVPIAAPSANLSTKPSPTMAGHVIRDLSGRIDMIIAGDDCDIGVESTIITLSPKAKLLRPGLITVDELREVCPDIEISDAVLNQHEGRPESPGMMYKHYSPRANVVLLKGSDQMRYEFLQDKKDCGILCYNEDTELLKYKFAMPVGSKASPKEQAKNLFAKLREFDDIEEVKTIYAPMTASEGIGLAVLNRLIRAAGFEILDLKKE